MKIVAGVEIGFHKVWMVWVCEGLIEIRNRDNTGKRWPRCPYPVIQYSSLRGAWVLGARVEIASIGITC